MKWIWRISAGVILFLVVALAGLYFTRDVALSPVVKRVINRWLESQGGARIRIRQLQGDYLTSIRINGVRTLQPGTGPLAALTIDSLQLNYRLLDLFYGQDEFFRRMRIRLRNARAVIRLPRDGPKPPAPGPAPRGGIRLPGAWPDLAADGLALEVISTDWFIRGRGLCLRLQSNGMARLRAERMTLFHPAVGRKDFPLDLALKAGPEKIVLQRLALDGNLLADEAQIVLGPKTDDGISFTANLRLFGGRLEASGLSRNGGQNIRLSLHGVNLASVADFFQWKEPLQGNIQFDMKGNLPGNDLQLLTADAWLRVDHARYGEWEIARLRMHAQARDGWLRVREFSGRSGDNALRIWDLAARMRDLDNSLEQFLDRVQGRFLLDLRDLSAVTSRLGLPAAARDRTVRQSLMAQGEIGRGRIALQRAEVEWQTAPRGLVLVHAPVSPARLLPAATPGGGRWLRPWKDVALLTAMDIEENLLTLRGMSCGLRALASGDGNRILRNLQGRFSLRLEDLSALLAVLGAGGTQDPLPVVIALNGEFLGGGAKLAGKAMAYNTHLELLRVEAVFPAEGSLANSRIDGELSWLAQDLRALGALAGLQRAAGSLQLTAAVQGTLAKPSGRLRLDAQRLAIAMTGLNTAADSLRADLGWQGGWMIPAWQGRVALQGGELRLGESMPSIQDLQLQIGLGRRLIVMERITGALGGSYFTLRGEIGSQGGAWPFFQARLQGENLLFYRSEGIKIRADADLNIVGPWEQLGVVGAVRLTDSRFTANFDFLDLLRGSGGRPSLQSGGFQLFSITDPPLKNARFHVRVATENPFVIKNNLAQGTIRPELLLTGTGEVPVLVGNIYIDPTRIALPAGILNVQSGYIRFLENAPDRPELVLTAESSLQGYEVTMQVEGPLEDPTVTLTSIPPLAEGELLLLVLAGLPPKVPVGQQPQQQQQAVLNVAVYLGLNYITQLFGSTSTEAQESVFDRLQIQVGQQLHRATLVQTLAARYLLAEGFLVSNDQLFLTSERDIYGDYNLGLRESIKFE